MFCFILVQHKGGVDIGVWAWLLIFLREREVEVALIVLVNEWWIQVVLIHSRVWSHILCLFHFANTESIGVNLPGVNMLKVSAINHTAWKYRTVQARSLPLLFGLAEPPGLCLSFVLREPVFNHIVVYCLNEHLLFIVFILSFFHIIFLSLAWTITNISCFRLLSLSLADKVALILAMNLKNWFIGQLFLKLSPLATEVYLLRRLQR